ncbi:MAG: aromatic ring-hydroxylating dioxygenase subunit alpha [Chloroflexi bacterium]|nr:aromatic ring-hydroxylating dioxygenase subunit alpha [Chloroflexota bacterium]
MLAQEVNERLTQVGPGTPMGTLLRRYWFPVAATSELEEHPTKGVRLLGEDLVLYKDRSGTYGLVDWACAHRRLNLLYGIPEENGLRCPYHGWLYDETGQCLEQPAEPPDSTFKERVQLKSYPVTQLGGLLFAYLGPQPAPLVPHWEPMVREHTARDVGWAVVPCNWLQIMENSLDPTHTEWLHRYFSHYAIERLGKGKDDPSFWRNAPPVVPHVKIGFDVFDYGIVKRRVLQGDTEDHPNWKYGHPIVFPNMLHDRGGNGFQIRVPMDDTHTLYLWYQCHDTDPSEPPQRDEEVPTYTVPLPGVDLQGRPIWSLLDHNAGQDNMAWMSQGPVSQRWLEKLGESDRGLIIYRRLLDQQINVAEDGGDPMNVFRDPATNVSIALPSEGMAEDKSWQAGLQRANGVSTGSTGKYSVINREAAQRKGVLVAEKPESAPIPAMAGTHLVR